MLRVIDRLNVGGPALQATVLSRGLDPARFDQRLLAGAVGPEEGDYAALRAPDLQAEPVVGLGREPHAGRDLRALYEISRVVREFRPDIVHTHKAKAGVLGRTAAWTHRVPATIHTFHGHLLTGYFSPAKTRVVVNVERTFARHTTRLVAVGTQVREELLEARIGRRSQYVVVPPGTGFPSVPDRDDARRHFSLPLDVPVVTFVGRLTPVKRPERFVDAAHPPGGAPGPRRTSSWRARGSSSTRSGAGAPARRPDPVPRVVRRRRAGLRRQRRGRCSPPTTKACRSR